MSEDDNLPRAGHRPGPYEVWFLTFTVPATGRGYWLRSTYLAPDRGPFSAGVWFARFDPTDPERTFGILSPSSTWSIAERQFEVRIGDSLMRSGQAEGVVEGGGHRARWDLRFPTGEPSWRLLPGWMYGRWAAPTKPISPNVDTRVTGTVEVDGQVERVDAAPAQQGHLWGRRHAERWAWAHCGDFLDEEAVVHAVTAQGRRGPFTTPYLSSIGVRWDGQWIRFTKMGRARDFGLGTWRIDMESRRYRLTGRIEAPARALLRARYEDPDGRPRYCHKSEIASARLALFERKAGGFEEVALLESRGTTHAEWAGHTPAAAVERSVIEVSS